MSFPLSVKSLEGFLPHRDSAIWVDDVLSVDSTSGTCRVIYSSQAPYSKNNSILESSYIEWMAQSFGYISAAQRKIGILPPEGDLQQAFLAALKNFEIISVPQHLEEGAQLIVSVKATHVVGPVTLVEGTVELNSKLLAKAQLKLFAVPKT